MDFPTKTNLAINIHKCLCLLCIIKHYSKTLSTMFCRALMFVHQIYQFLLDIQEQLNMHINVTQGNPQNTHICICTALLLTTLLLLSVSMGPFQGWYLHTRYNVWQLFRICPKTRLTETRIGCFVCISY